MLNYTCKTCGKSFRLSKGANYCSFCGSREIECKSVQTAREYVKEAAELVDELNELNEQYVKIYVKYARIAQMLRAYALRELISVEDIPKPKNRDLVGEFKKYMKEQNNS